MRCRKLQAIRPSQPPCGLQRQGGRPVLHAQTIALAGAAFSAATSADFR
ncbi:hypothetical protein D516_0805 [Rhodobacter sp. AKP1]|nr:hypothetical protein D516_0805 [Rhodobacter sp. AKP1]